MTLDEFNQAKAAGKVQAVDPGQADDGPDHAEALPQNTELTLDDFLPVLVPIIEGKKLLTSPPTFTPKNLIDAIQYVTDGTNYFEYIFMNGAWRFQKLAGSTTLPIFHYGDGNDGAVSMDGVNTYPSFASLSGSTYTLTRDVFATTFSVSNGVTLKPNGFRIFATVSITNAGTITRTGLNGSNGTNGGDAVGQNATGGPGTGGSGALGLSSGTLPGTTAGAAGNDGRGFGGANTGAGGAGVNSSTAILPSNGANGGAGGNGWGSSGGSNVASSGGTGGTTNQFTQPRQTQIVVNPSFGGGFFGLSASGGGGGGGGFGQHTNSAMATAGGGGGGGSASPGGMILLAAPTITNTGIITVQGGSGGNGGNGGNASGSTFGNEGGGGGGGGAPGNGGLVVFIYTTSLTQGTVVVAAGTAGAGGSSGSGSSGSAGGGLGAPGSQASAGSNGLIVALQTITT